MSVHARSDVVTVAVIDHDPATAGAIRAADGVEVVLVRTDGDGLVEELSRTVPDVVLIAADVDRLDCTQLCGEIDAVLPVCRVALVSTDGNAPFAAAIVGARGVVPRAEVIADPALWVHRVAGGEGSVPASWALAALAACEESGAPRLSATEREVLQRLAKDATPETVAGLHEVPAGLVRLHAGYALARLHRRYVEERARLAAAG